MRALKETDSPRNLRPPRLPRGVLLRVDVYRGADESIQVYARERLTPGSGDERNVVATLLLQIGLDVLNRFRDEPHDPAGSPSESSPLSTQPPGSVSQPIDGYKRLYG
jgi:hypothetical protein